MRRDGHRMGKVTLRSIWEHERRLASTVLGVVASIRPARRAVGLDVLEAIGTE
jgi:hypothetical protein